MRNRWALLGLVLSAAPLAVAAYAAGGPALDASPIPYLKGERWGFADAAKHLVIPAIYNEASRFVDGRALVQRGDHKGYVDPSGKEVVPLRYFFVGPFSDGLAEVSLGAVSARFGFVDRDGNVIVPVEYDEVRPFENGAARVRKGPAPDGLWGLVDTHGRFIVPPTRYRDVGNFSDDLAPVFEEHTSDLETFAFVDRSGKVLIPTTRYSWRGDVWREGRLPVRFKGKYGFIDKGGREVVPPVYSDVSGFFDGLSRVGRDGKVGFIDASGKVVVPIELDDAWLFAEGRARFVSQGKVGFIDRSGKAVIPARYDGAESFDGSGLAPVEIGGAWAFIDRTGTQVTPARFEFSTGFPAALCADWTSHEGLRAVRIDGKYGFIDDTGKVMIEPRFECVWSFDGGIAAAKIGGKWGFIDKTGKTVIPFKYSSVGERDPGGYSYYHAGGPFEAGFAAVTIVMPWNRWLRGYIDRQGNEFFEGPGIL